MRRKVGVAVSLVVLSLLTLAYVEYVYRPASRSSSPPSQSWAVLKTSVRNSISDDTVCRVLEFIGHTCPTKNAATYVPSIGNIELVSYQGGVFYAGNFTTGPYGYANSFTQTVWFTNSTIFCATPPAGDHPACPTN